LSFRETLIQRFINWSIEHVLIAHRWPFDKYRYFMR